MPAIEPVNPSCTMDIEVWKYLVMEGSVGRYISVTKGAKPVSNPAVRNIKAREFCLAALSVWLSSLSIGLVLSAGFSVLSIGFGVLPVCLSLLLAGVIVLSICLGVFPIGLKLLSICSGMLTAGLKVLSFRWLQKKSSIARPYDLDLCFNAAALYIKSCLLIPSETSAHSCFSASIL